MNEDEIKLNRDLLLEISAKKKEINHPNGMSGLNGITR